MILFALGQADFICTSLNDLMDFHFVQ